MNEFFENFKKYQETEESYTDISISNMQNRVCDLLEEDQLKKVNLAKKVGITKQQLNNFFNKGHNATLKTIGKIAYGLNKKVVISFVDKDVNNKDFYNYVKSYKLKNHKIVPNTKIDSKNKLFKKLQQYHITSINENNLDESSYVHFDRKKFSREKTLYKVYPVSQEPKAS